MAERLKLHDLLRARMATWVDDESTPLPPIVAQVAESALNAEESLPECLRSALASDAPETKVYIPGMGYLASMEVTMAELEALAACEHVLAIDPALKAHLLPSQEDKVDIESCGAEPKTIREVGVDGQG